MVEAKGDQQLFQKYKQAHTQGACSQYKLLKGAH
ncbi:hypothetical protein SDC9_174756 [bioreactor metagenome]|uniref:Uncharacterized protein n=1 Tax=bioreactor metagenome TaxID=1076179 RepID=A0A645GKS6_9ZZZZ